MLLPHHGLRQDSNCHYPAAQLPRAYPAPQSSSWVSLNLGNSSYRLCMSSSLWCFTLLPFTVAWARVTTKRETALTGAAVESSTPKRQERAEAPPSLPQMAASSPGTYPPPPHPRLQRCLPRGHTETSQDGHREFLGAALRKERPGGLQVVRSPETESRDQVQERKTLDRTVSSRIT